MADEIKLDIKKTEIPGELMINTGGYEYYVTINDPSDISLLFRHNQAEIYNHYFIGTTLYEIKRLAAVLNEIIKTVDNEK